MRFDAERSGAIRYDGAWMAAPTGLAQLVLALPWVAALNRRLVYSEGSGGSEGPRER